MRTATLRHPWVVSALDHLVAAYPERACPMRAINSRRFAPMFDASVLPTCRRSWKWSSGTSAAFVAFRHAARKFDRRSVSPCDPTKTRPVRPFSEYFARCTRRRRATPPDLLHALGLVLLGYASPHELVVGASRHLVDRPQQLDEGPMP
jgi:hypothetical protein